MHPDRRFLTVVGLSLLWAFLVAWVFYKLASPARASGPARSVKPVVVAVRPLPFGTVIAGDAVKIVRLPENLFPKGGFSQMEDVVGRPVIGAIEPDEPVIEARIGARGSGAGLAPMIPPGMRAISLKVNEVVGVAGFVLPGMRVDVLVTGRPAGHEETATVTVLQNVAVLSAGTSIQTDPKGQPINATVVTLLVDPGQAEALTLANNEGRIQLVLRNSTDQQIARTPGRQLHQIYATETPQPAVDRAPAASPKPAAPPVQRIPPAPRAPAPPAPLRQSPPAVAQEEVVMIRGNLKTKEPAPGR
jgi:pilus assembly protein CpaB